MARSLLSGLFILGSIVGLKADPGMWDIIAFSLEEKTYYAKVFSQGKLINNDFCYYEYSGEYVREVDEVFRNHLNNYEPEFYESVEYIHLGFTGYPEGDTILFIPKNQIQLDPELVRKKYKLIYAINGNAYGYTYTPTLSTKDNEWLRKNDMDTLFTFHDGGLCDMTLYGIKEKTTQEKIQKMKATFQKLTKVHHSLDQYFAELHRKKIIMIGFCSC